MVNLIALIMLTSIGCIRAFGRGCAFSQTTLTLSRTGLPAALGALRMMTQFADKEIYDINVTEEHPRVAETRLDLRRESFIRQVFGKKLLEIVLQK